MQPVFTCEFCQLEVDVHANNAFRRVIAWMPNKKSLSPAMVGPPTGWAHYGCIEIEKQNPIQKRSDKLF